MHPKKLGSNPRPNASTGTVFLFRYNTLLDKIINLALGDTTGRRFIRCTMVTSERGYPESTLLAAFHSNFNPDHIQVNIMYTEETYEELWENQFDVGSTLSRLHDTDLVIFFLGQEQLDSPVQLDRPLSDSMADSMEALLQSLGIPAFFVMVPPRPITRRTTPETYKARLGKLNDKIWKRTFKSCRNLLYFPRDFYTGKACNVEG